MSTPSTSSFALPILLTLFACGGEAEKPPEAPPVKAAEPAKVEPPAPVEVVAPTGPYTPDEQAAAAYEKARAAGVDATENARKGNPEAIAAGKVIYAAKCVTCHGEQGMGDGIAGQALPQKPGQFAWKERYESTSAGVKHWVVQNGITGTAMAPLGLSEAEAWDVLAFIDSEFHK